MTEEQRQWAIRRIEAKRGFWIHLVVYITVNALLVGIWATASDDFFWPIWPILGWGIGLVSHAIAVMVGPPQISEQRINRELERRS